MKRDHRDLDNFPSIDVLFGTVSIAWVPKAYLYRKGGSSQWCYAFEDDGANANTVLGASWMLHKEVIFDMVSQRVGVAQANCPEFKQRPPILKAVGTPISTRLAVPATTTPGSSRVNGTLLRSTEQQDTKQGVPWLRQDAVRVAGAVTGILLTLGMCIGVSSLVRRASSHKHEQLEDADDPRLPPQVLGSVAEREALAGPEAFVIGDEEEREHLSEVEESFAQYADDMETQVLQESPHMHDSAMNSGIRDNNSTWLDGDTGAPFFSGTSSVTRKNHQKQGSAADDSKAPQGALD